MSELSARFEGEVCPIHLFAGFALACALVLGLIAGIVFMFVNYDYNWKRQCAEVNGVMLEDMSNRRVCVKGPVQIVTIAARPW